MVAASLTSLNKEEFTNFIDSFDTVLTDCDGMYNIIIIYIYVHTYELSEKKVHMVENHASVIGYVVPIRCLNRVWKTF
jgi:hypothetical protein